MASPAETPGRSRLGRKSAAAYRTISEVSDELEVPQHVLRFWETKFTQVRPLKRGGGRRYYRPEDIDLLRRIQRLLYQEGYTIKGVQKLLREGRAAAVEKVIDEDGVTDNDTPGADHDPDDGALAEDGLASGATPADTIAPEAEPMGDGAAGDVAVSVTAPSAAAGAPSGDVPEGNPTSPSSLDPQIRMVLEHLLEDLKALRAALRR